MQLIELVLPLNGNQGQPIPGEEFERVRSELTERFGGVTAFFHSAAKGSWTDESGHVRREDVVILEVLVPELDRPWWKRYRAELERRFEQAELLIRAHAVERL